MAKHFVFGAFAALLALSALRAAADSTISGTWSMTPSAQTGKVFLDLTVEGVNGRTRDRTGSDYTAAAIGLTQPQLGAAGHPIAFTIARQAGSFQCDGWLAHGRGGGRLIFIPNAEFTKLMDERGYDLASDQQAKAAMLDVTIPYLDAISATGISRPSFEELTALRALGIDAGYIGGLRSAGTTIETADDAIELAALKVDAAYVKALAAAGYPRLSPRQLVRLRALKVDADYVRQLQARGYRHPSVEDLVRLKSTNPI